MPVPQKFNFLVERASCPFSKNALQGLLKVVQVLKAFIILKNRQDACSTKIQFSCGTGKMPVLKKLIENGETS
jgi:hypothetical protein